MLGAVRHNSRYDGAQAVVNTILIVAVTVLVPARFRRLRRIREVEPEVVSPEDRPFVVQLLSVGQLPGVTTEPSASAVDSEIDVAVEEPEEPEEVLVAPHDSEEELIPPQEEPAAGPPEPPAPPVHPMHPMPVRMYQRSAHEEVLVAPHDSEEEPIPPQEEPAAPSSEPPAAPAPAAHPSPVRIHPRPARAHVPQRRVTPARAPAPLPPEVEVVEPESESAFEATCEIRFWRGYLKANFYARVFDDHGEPLSVAESPLFRARGSGIPDKTDEAVAAHDALRKKLEDNGWRHVAAGKTWYSDVYGRPA